MMKSYLCLITFAILPLCALAQSEEEADFTADRPGATTGVDVLPKGRVQWETGFGYERTKVVEDVAVTTWTLNSSLLRWGISESAELRLQADYLYSSIEGTHVKGFSNVAFGTKVKLFEGWKAANKREQNGACTDSAEREQARLKAKAVPTISLLCNIFIPSSSDDDFLPEEWSGQMGLLFQNELTSWLSLGYEADLTWYGGTKPIFFWGACLGFQLNDRLSLMAEEYNYHYDGFHENWVELGAAYMLTPRLQLDLATDIYLNYPKRYFNLMVGIAWQITKR